MAIRAGVSALLLVGALFVGACSGDDDRRAADSKAPSAAASTDSEAPSPAPSKRTGLCQPFPDRLIGEFIAAYNGRDLEALENLFTSPRIDDVVAAAYAGESSFRATIPTRLEAAETGRYEPEIEATVYFCCVEALQNATKHAGESARATIEVRETEDALLFEVADNGSGLDPARTAFGAGLTNIRDRLEAIGGGLRIESTVGRGTRVVGTIPLVRRASDDSPVRSRLELPHGTVTFLFTDVEGSTRLLKQLGERYADALAEHQRILRKAFEEYGGHEIDSQGDSFFAAFRRAKDAARARACSR